MGRATCNRGAGLRLAGVGAALRLGVEAASASWALLALSVLLLDEALAIMRLMFDTVATGGGVLTSNSFAKARGTTLMVKRPIIKLRCSFWHSSTILVKRSWPSICTLLSKSSAFLAKRSSMAKSPVRALVMRASP